MKAHVNILFNPITHLAYVSKAIVYFVIYLIDHHIKQANFLHTLLWKVSCVF